MSQISVSDMKPHIVVAGDETDDDDLIQSYIDAAEAKIVNYVRRDLDTEFPGGWPPIFLQPIRLLVAHFWQNREVAIVGVSVNEMPFSVEYMLAEERNLAG